ncbi:hypothetical protein [Pseudomonas aeruginosa]|uniref:hypothetical protein n=1 Tax=Pseudomonas aeruginosa TaxID=287 RepID=UPI000AA2BD57|nr:hypothetical protein [Pseudomonas aeruginosa]
MKQLKQLFSLGKREAVIGRQQPAGNLSLLRNCHCRSQELPHFLDRKSLHLTLADS